MSKPASRNIFLAPRQNSVQNAQATLLMHLQQAMALHQQGKLGEASQIYQLVLARDPKQPHALHYLGVVKHQQGANAEAEPLIRRAIELTPKDPHAHSNLGLVLSALGRFDEALASYERALKLLPTFPEASYNRGNALRSLGRLEEALASYDVAIAANPRYLEALSSRGVVLGMLKRPAKALESFDKVLALKANHASVLNNRGTALRDLQRYQESLESYQRALAAKPDLLDAALNLGNTLFEMGDHRGAHAAFEQALQIDPNSALCRLKRVIANIPGIPAADDDIAASRANLARELAEFSTWLATHPVPDPLAVVGAGQPYYLSYQEYNNRDLLAQYGQICCDLMQTWQHSQGIVSAQPRQERTGSIRVGIASAHFREHSVWNAIVRGWLQALDTQRFDLCLFHLSDVSDAETEFARSKAASYHDGIKSPAQWARLIVAEKLDVLIYPELGMDELTPKLAAQRLVPVQVATWGHPETTGLRTIDHYLSAELFEGPQGQNAYTERLTCLPNLGTYFEPRGIEPQDIDLATLGVSASQPLFICPGTSFKYLPEYDRVFVEIAKRVPQAQFLFFGVRLLPMFAQKLIDRVSLAFERAGFHPADHVKMAPWPGNPSFYGLLKKPVVFLNTMGSDGFNTAMQAIDCCVPAVALEGQFMRGRQLSGILRRMGLDEYVCTSVDAYIDLAVRFATDADARQQMSAAIAARRSVLYRDLEPIRALEKFLTEQARPEVA